MNGFFLLPYEISSEPNSSHLFAQEHEKKAANLTLTAWFSLWTSQGLHLGPPDYESVALTN